MGGVVFQDLKRGVTLFGGCGVPYPLGGTTNIKYI